MRAGRFDNLDIRGIEEELRALTARELECCEWATIQLMMMESHVLAWPGVVGAEAVRRFDLGEIRCHAARSLFSPAMRTKIDLQHLYTRAWLLLPERCPWTLDTLLAQGDAARHCKPD